MPRDVPDLEFTDHPLNLLYRPVEFRAWCERVGGADEALPLLGEALLPYQLQYGADATLVFLWKIAHVDAYFQERELDP